MKGRRAAVAVFFFLSGACALVYEVAWTKKLSLVFGNTTYAVSIIIGSFMLGLGLGSLLAGKIVDRREKHALLVYGMLEGFIGLFAFIFPLLLGAISGLFLIIYPVLEGVPALAHGVRLLLVFLTLAVPTFMMGATLPVVSRWYVRSIGKAGESVGYLYGLNTLGAVAGTIAGGFVLMELFGVIGSTFVAAGVNLAIALAAVVLAFSGGDRPARDPLQPGKLVVANPALFRLALVGVGAAGFLSLAFEVVATRMLSFFMQSHIYAFTSMLAVFLFGLAIGAFSFARIARSGRHVAGVLALVFVLLCAYCFAIVLPYPLGFGNFFDTTRLLAEAFGEATKLQVVATFLTTSLIILFIPAFLMGGVFPLACRIFLSSIDSLGASVGRLYFANTLGAVGGSLAAGFVLVPLLGMRTAVTIIGAVYLLMAVGSFAVWEEVSRFKRTALAAAGVVLCVALLVARGSEVEFIRYSKVFKSKVTRANYSMTLLDYKEGLSFAASVVKDTNGDVQYLYTDHFMATNDGESIKYMRMMGHLPALLNAEYPKNALVICFGAGNTAGALSAYELEAIDIVEISREVIEFAPYFKDVNKGILEAENVRVHVDDGRNFVLTHPGPYDIITLDPLLPHSPAAIDFYTRDFFGLCRERLSDGGVMAQWLPIHALHLDNYKIIIRTFLDVFPEGSLWFFENSTILIGMKRPLEIDYAKFFKRYYTSAIVENLGEVNLDDPILILDAFVADGRELHEYATDAPIMTDEWPIIEFSELKPPEFEKGPYLKTVLSEVARLKCPIGGRVVVGAEGEAAKEIRKAIDLYFRSNAICFEGRIIEASDKVDFPAAARKYSEALSLNPDDKNAAVLKRNANFNAHMAAGYDALTSFDSGGRKDEVLLSLARRELGAALVNKSGDPNALYYYGLVEARYGNSEQALSMIRRVVDEDPGHWRAYLTLVSICWNRGEEGRAAEYYRKLMDTNPHCLDDTSEDRRAEFEELLEKVRKQISEDK